LLFTESERHDKHEKMKFFPRLVLFALLSASLTSCGTLSGLMRSYPMRILDQTGSALMGYLAENDSPTNATPAAMQNRARQVESRGIYAGRASATAAAGQSMAAR
jgi:hypothetical protein